MTSRATCSSLENRLSSWYCWRSVSWQDLGCNILRFLYRGLRPPAPVVKFLQNASAALIQGVASQVHDVEGIHDRPRAGEFFGGGALNAGESNHCNDLYVAAPCIGAEASQVLKICLERPGTMSRSREGPRRSWMGVESKITVTNLSP